MTAQIIIILICLAGSAFFSSCETAYNLANESQLEKMLKKVLSINLLTVFPRIITLRLVQYLSATTS